MKLTLPQQDIYFEQLLYPDEPIYNIGAKISISGKIDLTIFKKAYVELINQHDAYRTILKKTSEGIIIHIAEDHKSELNLVDFSDSKDANEDANSYMQNEFLKPFELLNDKLLHVFTLVRVSQDFHYLFSVYHHIITDGWGTSLMFQRLVQNYNEIYEFGEIKTNYPFCYSDFVKDDEAYQNSEEFVKDKTYWSEKFEVMSEPLLERKKSDTLAGKTLNVNRSDRKELTISREKYNELNQFAENCKSSTFQIILGILYVYFGRKHQKNDFAIGLPVLNRSKSSYKKTVGLFMGISPLRMKLDFEATFENLITQIKNQLRQDYRHQRFPLGKLIQELHLFNEKERLFNITLSYEKQNYAANIINTQTRVIPLSHKSERVALAIYIREFDVSEDVKIDFDYNLNYFNDEQISQVVEHFQTLMNDVLKYSNKKLNAFSYLTKREEHQLLVEFNSTKTVFPKGKTIIDLFKEQVDKLPQKVALKDDKSVFSYAELDKLSDQIAAYLIKNYGTHDESPISVLLERSAEMVIILLGILKSGRAYIPLDPTFPKERLTYIFSNSQTKILISEKKFELEYARDLVVISTENIRSGIDKFEGITSHRIIPPQSTAYIIYTSGSTGNPKGVEIGHESLANFLTSIQHLPGINSDDSLFSVTTSSFDISILEFFSPLISGAVLYIANQVTLADPYLIIQKLEEIKPTIIQATPSFYQMLFNANWQGNKNLKILCGGDLLSEQLAEKLLNCSLEIWNMYGPTETTIWSSIKKIEYPADAFNIGKPIRNTQFYILDDKLNLKPIGTEGAIFIGGTGLAKGYYKNKPLTKEKFIPNPFDAEGLIYETGDLGKWTEKGEIEFLGRNDNQVKIRGYRIELGDIETQLNKLTYVKASVVIAKKYDNQEAILVAYILKEVEEINLEDIANELTLVLPHYMLPNVIIPLDEFPITPNQKIDRKFLTQRSISQNVTQNNFREPTSELEKTIHVYWQKVLNHKDPVSIHDNFFALGGHSLNAVKLIGLIEKGLSLSISLKTIFDFPTIQSLSLYLESKQENKIPSLVKAKSKELYELTPSQYSIWLASQHTQGSIAYNMAAGYKVDGVIDLDGLAAATNELISKYEILRTNFVEKNGIPYQKINNTNRRLTIQIHKPEMNEMDELINKLVNLEFSLSSDLLIKIDLIQQETNQFILIFTTHHIIMDGLSLEAFIKEFIENLKGKGRIDFSNEDVILFQFKDFSEWLNEKLTQEAGKREQFWKNYFQGYVYKDFFNSDFQFENLLQHAGRHEFDFTAEFTEDLKKQSIRMQLTPYTILIAALNILIYKITNHKDICIGTVNSGRAIAELENQIGMFVETLVVRTQIQENATSVDLLKNVQNNLLVINDYIGIPFDKLPHPIFDAILVYQNPEFSFETIIDVGDFKLSAYPVRNKYSRMPIVFNFWESENKLKGTIDYNSNLFESKTIRTIAEKYSKVLNEVVGDPSIKIALINDTIGQKINASLNFDFNF